MKKVTSLFFLLILISVFGCNNDDNNNEVSNCEISVYALNHVSDTDTYGIQYGETLESSEMHTVNEATYNFYSSRIAEGNDCWVGEQ